MTCRKAAPFIDDLVDGELSAELKQEVQWHLNSCQKCRVKAAESNQLKFVLKAFIVRDPGQDYFNALTESILSRIFVRREQVSRAH